MELATQTLTGSYVELVTLHVDFKESLRTAADDGRIWEHTNSSAQGADFDKWFSAAIAARDSGAAIPYVVRLNADRRIVGSTRFLNIAPQHKRVEIGSTWYHPDVWGTRVNPECKLLLLSRAFEAFGANRVEFCTDARNRRSQSAIEKLGAVREGILRAHMVVQNGRIRDTVIYSIVAAEWATVKAKLEQRLRNR